MPALFGRLAPWTDLVCRPGHSRQDRLVTGRCSVVIGLHRELFARLLRLELPQFALVTF